MQHTGVQVSCGGGKTDLPVAGYFLARPRALSGLLAAPLHQAMLASKEDITERCGGLGWHWESIPL